MRSILISSCRARSVSDIRFNTFSMLYLDAARRYDSSLRLEDEHTIRIHPRKSPDEFIENLDELHGV